MILSNLRKTDENPKGTTKMYTQTQLWKRKKDVLCRIIRGTFVIHRRQTSSL